MELSWVWVLVPSLTAGAGAFFGAYLRKKGENLATHEDIGKLVDQVEAVTTATKKIEAQISDQVWDRQKRWELKKDALFDTAKKITLVNDALNEMYAVYHTNALYRPVPPERLKKANEAYAAWNVAASALDGTTLLIDLLCAKPMATGLISLSVFLRCISKEIAEGNPEFHQQSTRELVAKLEAVKNLMRKELETPLA